MKKSLFVAGEYSLLLFCAVFFWAKNLSSYGYPFALVASVACLATAIWCRIGYRRQIENDLLDTLGAMVIEHSEERSKEE